MFDVRTTRKIQRVLAGLPRGRDEEILTATSRLLHGAHVVVPDDLRRSVMGLEPAEAPARFARLRIVTQIVCLRVFWRLPLLSAIWVAWLGFATCRMARKEVPLASLRDPAEGTTHDVAPMYHQHLAASLSKRLDRFTGENSATLARLSAELSAACRRRAVLVAELRCLEQMAAQDDSKFTAGTARWALVLAGLLGIVTSWNAFRDLGLLGLTFPLAALMSVTMALAVVVVGEACGSVWYTMVRNQKRDPTVLDLAARAPRARFLAIVVSAVVAVLATTVVTLRASHGESRALWFVVGLGTLALAAYGGAGRLIHDEYLGLSKLRKRIRKTDERISALERRYAKTTRVTLAQAIDLYDVAGEINHRAALVFSREYRRSNRRNSPPAMQALERPTIAELRERLILPKVSEGPGDRSGEMDARELTCGLPLALACGDVTSRRIARASAESEQQVALFARDRSRAAPPLDAFSSSAATARASGAEFLRTFVAALESEERELILLRAARSLEWMQAEHAPKERRSESALHPDRAERERIRKAMVNANAREIYVALLRALRELSDGPLALRLGVVEREKQADSTEGLWLSADMPLQRGADRQRKPRLFFISSKCMLNNVIVPGPTAVISARSRPDKAVLQVLADIREADPGAQIIGVDVDDFDRDVGHLLGDDRMPFTLRLPGLLEQRGAPLGPMAMLLPVNPDTKNVEIRGHAARDLRGLCVGRNGEWLLARKTIVEDGDEDGKLITRPVMATVTEPLRVCPVRGEPWFPARIVRIADVDRQAQISSQRLVCVMGVDDPDDAIDLAMATVSTTDQHPRIAAFLRARDEARVFAGEQRLRHVHDNDRAIAMVAFAANQLDRLRQTDMPQAAPTPPRSG